MGVLLSPHGGKRVQGHGMARHQGVEEMPQRRQRQIPGGVRSGQVLDEAPGQSPGVTWRSSMPCASHQVRKRPTGRGTSTFVIFQPSPTPDTVHGNRHDVGSRPDVSEPENPQYLQRLGFIDFPNPAVL